MPDLEAIVSRVYDPVNQALRISGFGGGGGDGDPHLIIQRGDVTILDPCDTIDFSTDFGIAQSPAGEANVTIGSVIARQAAVDALDMSSMLLDTGVFTGLLVDGTVTNGQELGEFIDQMVLTSTVDATGFSGNLTPTDDTLQEIAEKFDAYVPETGVGTVTSVNGILPIDGDITLAAADIDAVDIDQLGVANGVATLDSLAILELAQWPAFVSEVNGMTGEVTILGSGIFIDASAFAGNLDPGVTDVQLLAEAMDDLTVAGAGHTINENLAPRTTRANLNFGDGFDVTDDAGNNATTVTVDLAELALVAGTDIQAFDADLAAIAGLTRTRGDLLVGGASAWTDLAVGTSGTLLRSDGTDPAWVSLATAGIQPLDADLTSIAALTVTRGDLMVGNATPAWSDLAVGTSGTVLRSDGTDVTWASLSTAGIQPLDATLTSLAAYNTNGLLTQTAADTFAGRTLTGTDKIVAVTNGNGVSGNPTVTLSLREQSQDVSRRAGAMYSGRIKTQLVRDLFIGDSIARGCGGTLGTSDWTTVYAEIESNAGGVANNGPGIKLCAEDESVYGSFKWSDLSQGSAATGGISTGSSAWQLTSSGHTIGDTARFRRAEVVFRKAASGSPTIEISTDNGSTWSSPVSTTGTGYGTWLSPDLGTTDSRTLKVRTAASGTAIIEGYTPYLTDGTIGYVPDNLGHGGTDTTSWTTNRGWETYATLVAPRRIVIAVGENHALNGDSLGTMTAGLTTIVQRAKAAAPLAEIVVIGEQYAWATGLTDVTYATWSNTWIPAIEAICVSEAVTFIDHNQIFGDCSEHDDRWTITMDGGLHFGAAGQRARAQVTFARLSHGYTYPAIEPSAINSGVLAGGGRFRISDGGSNSVGLAVYADQGDTQPMAALGGFFGAPLVAMGAGGTTAADCLLGRDSTDHVFTITPGFDVTSLAGGGEIRVRDFGSNSPAIGVYGVAADTQARLSLGLLVGSARILWGNGGSTAPDIYWRRSAAGTFEHADGTDADGSVRLYAGTYAATQLSGVAIRNNAADSEASIALQSYGAAPTLAFGPGGSTAADTTLSRDSAGVFRAPGIALDTGAGEVRIHAVSTKPTINLFDVSSDTQPMLSFGLPFDVPLIAFGPGGSTAVDATISRTATAQLSFTGTSYDFTALTRMPGVGGPFDMYAGPAGGRLRFYEEFDRSTAANTTNSTFYGNKATLLYLSGASAGAAADLTGTELVGGHTVYGVGQLTTGTATTGRASVAPLAAYYVYNQADTFRFLARVRIGTLSDGTNTFIVRVGMCDATTGVTPTNGGFYVEANSGANWRCFNDDDTTRTDGNSGIAVANSAYVNIGIHYDGTTCHFWMSTGLNAMTEVVTQATNRPDNSTALAPCVAIIKSAGGTARTVNIDGWGYDIPFVRGMNFSL